MRRDMMMGLITGSLIGATVGMYAVSNMSPREQKRMMKRGKKAVSTAAHMMNNMNMF
ncbi:MAG: YtxH domain-containing protein [Clostridiaceae bacterium]|nr:YtxH domain-containing protein [Clostridiaceae bacterium]